MKSSVLPHQLYAIKISFYFFNLYLLFKLLSLVLLTRVWDEVKKIHLLYGGLVQDTRGGARTKEQQQIKVP